MPTNTNHTIKILVWINGILEIIEVQKVFPTYKAALAHAKEYGSKVHHPRYKLKIYNFLGEVVFVEEEVATPDPIVYA